MGYQKCPNCGFNNSSFGKLCLRCARPLATGPIASAPTGELSRWQLSRSRTAPLVTRAAPTTLPLPDVPLVERRIPYSDTARPENYETGGFWRDGNLLVLHKQATLPGRCVKCNEPASDKRIKHTLTWHEPVFYWLLLAGGLVYSIVTMFVSKKAKVEIPLCQKHLAKRRTAMNISVIIIISSLIVLYGGIHQDWIGLSIFAVLVFFAGCALAKYSKPVVKAKKISDHHIWLKGADKDYLAQTPSC